MIQVDDEDTDAVNSEEEGFMMEAFYECCDRLGLTDQTTGIDALLCNAFLARAQSSPESMERCKAAIRKILAAFPEADWVLALRGEKK